jgi:hypothetical protein
MAKADRVHSTPPTNTSAPTPQSSRRGFLLQAAGVVAGGAALGAGLPLPEPLAATVQERADKYPDPIFAAITAHRSAHEELNKAITAADVKPSRRTERPSVRILVGSKDGTKSSWTETEGGGFTLIVTPTGQKEPVYASCPAQIRENVPKDIQSDARKAWIADREAELEAAERRIAKRWARTKIGKLEAALDEAYTVERDRMWDLIWAMPTTLGGLAALFQYCREQETINEMVAWDEWEDALEWTMECAVCALAGLPEPPMSEVVADVWQRGRENVSAGKYETA